MKFITFDMFNVAKVAEIAQAYDTLRESIAASKSGMEIPYHGVIQGLAFPGQPSDKMVSITLADVPNNEALSAALYPMVAAGGTLWSVPILDATTSAVAALTTSKQWFTVPK
jgi:hypothetical protein